MPVKNQTSYLALLLMLAALNVEISLAEATLSPEQKTISGRIARIQKVLQEKSTAFQEQFSPVTLSGDGIKKEEISFWGDWGDGGYRRGGSGGWVDAWSPGWGDWGDSPSWGDWGDVW